MTDNKDALDVDHRAWEIAWTLDSCDAESAIVALCARVREDALRPVGDVEKDLIEKLAAIEHERWSRWHKHARKNWTSDRVERWDRQAETTYGNLSESEKELDRHEVMEYWPLIKALCARVEAAAKLNCVNNHADSERVKEWAWSANRKPANTAFTEGPNRQMAYLIEQVEFDARSKEKERCAKIARNYLSRTFRLNFKCVCGHDFGGHDLTGKIKFKQDGCCLCECSAFTFVRTLPEEILADKGGENQANITKLI